MLSVEDVSEILGAVHVPGLKYRTALSISFGAGLSFFGDLEQPLDQSDDRHRPATMRV